VFSIIISEKGGAERRESFDKNEINVGRVQGNDLMLPKGNVSKHHARLLFRDGRFIVTDLKSTNGTYVNGRKIAQATIVREGDKIYIGDFVLRLETNGAGAAPQPEATSNEEESIRTLARDGGGPPGGGMPPPGRPVPASPAVTLKAPTHPPGAPMPRPQVSNVSNVPPNVIMGQGGPAGQFSPMDDNDDSSQMAKPRLPSAAPPAASPLGGSVGVGSPGGPPPGAGPPLGGPVRPMTMPLNQMSPPIIGRPPTAPPGGMTPIGAPPPAPVVNFPPQPAPPPPPPPPPQPMPAVGQGPTLDRTGDRPSAPQGPPPAAQSAPSVPPPRPTAPPQRQPPKETPAQAGRRLALMTLLDRIADAVDLTPLRQSPQLPDGLAQQIERAARDQANAMRVEGDAPEGIDLDAVVRDAHRELVGLGAFGALLEDEEVAEINCVRFDQLFTVRSNGIVPELAAFSSEEALQRVIARLAYQSGDPWKAGETVLERRLPRASFVAITPPAASGHVVSIRKRRRIESSLDELTRSGAISRAMAQFLEACVVRCRWAADARRGGPVPSLPAAAGTRRGGLR
jgi:pilus assembly protein CpaF